MKRKTVDGPLYSYKERKTEDVMSERRREGRLMEGPVGPGKGLFVCFIFLLLRCN